MSMTFPALNEALITAQLRYGVDSQEARIWKAKIDRLGSITDEEIQAAKGKPNPLALIVAANAECPRKVLDLLKAFPVTEQTRTLDRAARSVLHWDCRFDGICRPTFVQIKDLARQVAQDYDVRASLSLEPAGVAQ